MLRLLSSENGLLEVVQQGICESRTYASRLDKCCAMRVLVQAYKLPTFITLYAFIANCMFFCFVGANKTVNESHKNVDV